MAKSMLSEKDLLNPEEAILYFGFSRRRWYQYLEQKESKRFIVLFRKRKLVLREEFEKYLKENPKVKEELVNAEARRPKTRLEK